MQNQAILERPKVAVNQAVAIAIDFFKQVFSRGLPLNNVQLEELEMSDDGKRWLITVGYDDPAPPATLMEQAMRLRPSRKYKVVHVDAESGQASAVKNRAA
jgi:hypothetical protein